MLAISSAAGEGHLEISNESNGEESSNHRKIVLSNLKAPFEIMEKSCLNFYK